MDSVRKDDNFLSYIIRQQWETRDAFLSRRPELTKYQVAETDDFTKGVWLLRLLSSEAPLGSVESYEKSCEEMEHRARENLQRARTRLLESATKLLVLFQLLETTTMKPIAIDDIRFNAKTRFTYQKARTSFQFSDKFTTLKDEIIPLLESIVDALGRRDELEAFSRVVTDKANKIKSFVSNIGADVPIILNAAAVSTVDFIERTNEFTSAVEDNGHQVLLEQCNETRNKLNKRKHASMCRDLCIKTFPGLVYECDICYNNCLRDFTSKNTT